MSIKLDWEVSDAPDDTGKLNRAGSATPAAPVPHLAESPQPAARRRLWSWTLLALVAVTAIGLTATWYISRQGWQRVTSDVQALVRYEEEAAYAGNVALALGVQDQDNRDWLAVRRDDFEAARPAPRPLPMLTPATHAFAVDAVTALDSDFVLAEVRREFTTPDGQTLTFVLPQFYRRRGLDDWQRTAPPGQFWGNWIDWQGQYLQVRHSERDAAVVAAVAPRLEVWLAQACALWGDRCAAVLPAKLYLSGYVGSLEYDPLFNVEVWVEFGDGVPTLAADYFLSVPSPQIAGQPANAAGQAYLAEYLAVRLIASLADRATESLDESLALTAQAIAALDLARADPGYAGLTNIRTETIPQPEAAPIVTPAPRATRVPPFASNTAVPATPLVTYYTVLAGDTLSGIADFYGVTVDAILSANDLKDPDVIFVSVVLTIPLPQ